MKTQKRLLTLAMVVLAGFASLVLLVGCARDQGPSPVTQPVSSANGQPDLMRGLGPSGPHLGPSVNQVEASIDPNGDNLELNDGDHAVKVVFPKGAVAQTVDVTLTLLDAEHVQFTLTPADLVLLKPIQLSVQKLDKTTRAMLVPAQLFHQESGQWTAIGLPTGGNEVKGTNSGLGEFAVQSIGFGGRPIEILRWLSGPAYTTALVQAYHGATITCGRYSVAIPSLALRADTWITVRDPGSPYLLCQLEPEGTVFSIPARLTLDCTGLDTDPFTDWTVWYFNPTTSSWENMGGTFDGKKIRANLPHFSMWAAGRAGW